MRDRKIRALALGVTLSFGVLVTGCSGERALEESSGKAAEESLLESGAEDPENQQGQLKNFEAKTLDGTSFTQEDLASKDVTVINFWSVSCAPCVEELPELAKLEKALPENVQLITVCLDGASESAKEILKEAGFEGLTLTEADGDFLELIGELQYTPTTILVDGDGNLVGETIIGGRDGAFFAEAVNQALRSMGKAEIDYAGE